jgi:hypothetical protein
MAKERSDCRPGSPPPTPTPLILFRGAAEKDERGIFIIASLPRAALRLPWAIIFRPDGARSSPRYARKPPNAPGERPEKLT